MSYIGSTPTTQSFIAGTDYFNGDGTTVNFTLSRAVNSVNDIEVIVNNVEQIPSGYSVSGTTLTFSVAPSSGTSNVYVRYLSTTNLSLAIPSGTSATFNTIAATTLSVTGVTTFAAGTAALPAITTTGDTNTGIFFPAADTIAFAEGGAEAMRIDSSGNVGIGGTVTNDGGYAKCLQVTGSTEAALELKTGSNFSYVAQNGTTLQIRNNATAGIMNFATESTERARIDSSGNFMVGTTSVVLSGKITSSFAGNAINGATFNDTTSASGAGFCIFSIGGSLIGTITRVGATSAVAYNTTSDQRLKSNIADSQSVLDKLLQVKVRQFDWTEGQVHQDYGFIAQELEPVLSGVVTKGKTDEDVWQLDYSKLTPHLLKAIQEQQALITALTTRITALENNNATQ